MGSYGLYSLRRGARWNSAASPARRAYREIIIPRETDRFRVRLMRRRIGAANGAPIGSVIPGATWGSFPRQIESNDSRLSARESGGTPRNSLGVSGYARGAVARRVENRSRTQRKSALCLVSGRGDASLALRVRCRSYRSGYLRARDEVDSALCALLQLHGSRFCSL